MTGLVRLGRLLPGLWLGLMLCVGLMATPAPFALLAPADAGRVVGRILSQEAHASLLFGVVLLVLERLRTRAAAAAGSASALGPDLLLVLGTLLLTIAGYFAVLPFMAAARAGQGPLSFGELHAISAASFALKAVLVAVLAWRGTRR